MNRWFHALVFAAFLVCGSSALLAQKTIYVRTDGNDADDGLTEATAKVTLAAAIDAAANADNDVIDMGPGNFAGATFAKDVVIRGANANATIGGWGDETVITSTLDYGNSTVSVEGVAFNAITPVASTRYINVSNCVFRESNTISLSYGTAGFEVRFTACAFDGDINDGGGVTVGNAISVQPNGTPNMCDFAGLMSLTVLETTFTDYQNGPISATGYKLASIKNCEFSNCNTSETGTVAAVSLNPYNGLASCNQANLNGKDIGDASVMNNRFEGCRNALRVFNGDGNAGTWVFQPVVQYNLFRNTPTGYYALWVDKIDVNSTYNSFGASSGNIIRDYESIRDITRGHGGYGPYMTSDFDTDNGAIGYQPDWNTNNGPVIASNYWYSFFSLKAAIEATPSYGQTLYLYPMDYDVSTPPTSAGYAITKPISFMNQSWIGNALTYAGDWPVIRGQLTFSGVQFSMNSVKLAPLTQTQIDKLNFSARPSGVTLLTLNNTSSVNIDNCWFEADPVSVVSTVPTAGVIAVNREGDVAISQTKITRPVSTGSEPQQYIRAITFGPGNGSRNFSVYNNRIEGTIQISGMSLLSQVNINGNTIDNAGVDGITFSGNTIRTAYVNNNTISNSRQNGISIRDRVTVGNSWAAEFANNLITGSGTSGSTYAAINIASLSYGQQSYQNNSLAGQSGTNKSFINGRTGSTPTATCNWWGSTSEDDIVTYITGAVQYDDGWSGWRADGSNANEGFAPGYQPMGDCRVRSYSIALAPLDATCFGSATGSIATTLTGSYDPNPAKYVWSKTGDGSFSSSDKDPANLAAGTYNVTVTSNTGNVRRKSAIVRQPTQITASLGSADVTCAGANDGGIKFYDPTGGWFADNVVSMSYSYRVDNISGTVGDAGPQSQRAFYGLAAGTYDCYVIADGITPTCEAKVGQVVINQPDPISATVAKVNISCSGSNDGSISVTNVSGGAPFGSTTPVAYSYRLDRQGGATGDRPTQSTGSFTGLMPGTYDVLVSVNDSDPLCEQRVSTISILEPSELTGTASKTNSTCYGANNGSITVSGAAGGTHAELVNQPYSYRVDRQGTSLGDVGPQSQASFSNLAPGVYDVYLIASGVTPTCEVKVSTLTVLEPSQITATVAKVNISCNGSTNGRLTISGTSGGTHAERVSQSYQYRIDRQGTSVGDAGPQASGSFLNLPAGVYDVYAVAVGVTPLCETKLSTETIYEPSLASATVSKVNVTCNGGADGSITVTNPAGSTHADAPTRNYSFRVVRTGGGYTQANSTGQFDGMIAGTYTVSLIAAAALPTIPVCTTLVATISVLEPSSVGTGLYAVNFNGVYVVYGGNSTQNVRGSFGPDSAFQAGWNNVSMGVAVNFGAFGKSIDFTITDAGGANPIDMNVTLDNQGGNAGGGTASTSNFDVLYATGIRSNDGWTRITNKTSMPYETYSVYLYATGADANYSVNGRTTPDAFAGSGSFTSSNTKYYSGLSGPLTITQRENAVINGFSIIGPGFASTNHITCNGAGNGSIVLNTITGGTHAEAPSRTYTYRALRSGGGYDVSNTTGSFVSLPAGTYEVTATTPAVPLAAECTTVLGKRTIFEPSAVTATVAKTNISCNGSNNGSITVSAVAGGTHTNAPSRTYSYRAVRAEGGYDQTNSTGSFTSLQPGTYTMSVIAAAIGTSVPECTTSVTTQNINEPTSITATVVKSNISCNGANDGTITASNPQGGTQADAASRTYSYRAQRTGGGFDQTNSTGSFTGLGTGTYTVSVIVAASGSTPACTTQVATHVINEPAAITADVAKTNISCNGSNDGTISVTSAAGGTHPDAVTRTYSYRAIRTGGGFDQTNSTGSFTGLSAGTYSVSVIAAAVGSTVPACTTSFASQAITEPTAITATVAKANISCNGSNNGSITVSATAGGTSADAGSRTYTYRAVRSTGGFDQTNSTGSFTGLQSGTYNMSIIAAAIGSTVPACTTSVAAQVINEPTSVTASLAKTNISCNGANDGTITVSAATGGTHADAASRTYTFRALRTGGGYDQTNSTGSFTNLQSGTYTMSVIAAAIGSSVPVCTTSVSTQIINEPTPVTASTSKVNISCNGANDGSISVTPATGGTHADAASRTYSYRAVRSAGGYDQTNSTGSFTGLQPGTYTMSVITGAIGSTVPACTTAVTSQTINEPTVVSATLAKVNISCNGSNNGSISVTSPLGGTHADAASRTYTYRAVRTGGGFDQTNGTGSFTSLQPGTYNMSVITAAIGSTVPACTTSVAAQVINEPSAVTASVAKTNFTCNGANDGTITVTNVAGGTHADAASRTYTFRAMRTGGGFDQTNSTGAFTGLGTGDYQISVIAAAVGSSVPVCTTAVSTQTIYSPTTVSASVAKNHISCNGANDGAITVTGAAGGTQTDAPSRTYSYRAQRAGGGYDQTNSTGSFTGLSSGAYSVWVIANATGSTPACTTSLTGQTINEPTAITATTNKVNVTCNGAANGSITVTSPAGGTHGEATPRTYTYRVVRSGGGYDQTNGTGSFTALAPGTYTVNVIAAAIGSTVPACTTLVSTQTITEPTSLSANPQVTSNFNGAQLSCPNSADGSLAANAAGGTTPYTYLWEKSVSGTWTTVGTTATLTGVSAGSFRVRITDNQSCTTTRGVELIGPAQTIILGATKSSYNGQDISCFGSSDGQITVNASGGTTPLQFSKDNGISWQASNVFGNLGAGAYTVLVKDVNNCASLPLAVTVSQPTAVSVSSISSNGPVNSGQAIEITAVISGGTQYSSGNKYMYSWSRPRATAQTPSFTSESGSGTITAKFTISAAAEDDNGQYILTATDRNGCSKTANLTVTVYPTTIYVSTSGSDATGDGRSSNPLRTIQKANDVVQAGNTIEVLSGTFNESPVITKQVTINGTSTTFLGTGKFFVYGTTSTITWGANWPTSTWNNLGVNANATGALSTVYNKVNAGASSTLWFIGSHTIGTALTVDKELTLRGATSSAGVASYTGCDVEPPATITFTGTGADSVLFRFTGSATKQIRDLTLRIPFAGKFAQVDVGSSGDVSQVLNVRFEWDNNNNVADGYRRIFGVTNGAYSGNEKFDVAKFINDAADEVFGTGRVVFGSNGPLPWTALSTGWKAEDGNFDANLSKIRTIQPMKSDVPLQNLISTTRRPTLYTTGSPYNGKFYLGFDDALTQHLEGNSSEDIVGGDQKALFVVFRPLVNSAEHQVVYKHGDDDEGMSVVHLKDGRISLNIYNGNTNTTRESWIFESGATHSSTGFDDEVLIAQIYFNGNGDNNEARRVGASLDRSSGRVTTEINHAGDDKTNGYVSNTAFSSFSLTTPAVAGAANVTSLGARSGSIYYASWNAAAAPPAAVDNAVTTIGRSNFYQGSAAEVLILNDASITNRDAAYCYLRNKYFSGDQTVENGLDKRVVAGDDRGIDESLLAWPNPADAQLSFEAIIPQSGNVTVTLRDALGKIVRVLFDEYVQGGTILPVTRQINDVMSGFYMLQLEAAGDVNKAVPVVVRH